MDEFTRRDNKLKDVFKTPIMRNVSLAITILAITFLIPVLIGFGKEGFSEQVILNFFTVYQSFVYAGLFTVLIGMILLYILQKNKFDNSKFDSVLFAGQGEKPSLLSKFSFMKNVSNTQLFLLSLIIFSSIMLINFLSPKQIMFTGVARLGQQFTNLDNTIFSTALVPAAENLGLMIVIVITVIVMVILDRKFNFDDSTTIALTFISGIILSLIYGVINHLMRYGSSGYDMIGVASFWGIIGLLTFLTGSFIPGWVLHLVNNLFVDLKQYFSSSATGVIAGFIIILLIILYIRLYVIKGSKKK